jgi:hypothetical protein
MPAVRTLHRSVRVQEETLRELDQLRSLTPTQTAHMHQLRKLQTGRNKALMAKTHRANALQAAAKILGTMEVECDQSNDVTSVIDRLKTALLWTSNRLHHAQNDILKHVEKHRLTEIQLHNVQIQLRNENSPSDPSGMLDLKLEV